MVRLCLRILICWTLLCRGAVMAASSAEEHDFKVAANAFGLRAWDYAEKKFGEFVQKYPKSADVPDAILFQAKARYGLGRFAGTMELLSTNFNQAGMWADEYVYWMAEAQFSGSNYTSAADLFARLYHDFPQSPKSLEAGIGQAVAVARLPDWPRVVQLLSDTKSLFQQAAQSMPTNEFVVQGYLLLGEAHLALRDFGGVAAALRFLEAQPLGVQAAWRREYLRCRLMLAEGRTENALRVTTNLLALAAASSAASGSTNAITALPAEHYAVIPAAHLLPESWSIRASILERSTQYAEAIAAYTNNLSTNTPVEQQRRALLRIAQLSLAETNLAKAIETLDTFWKQATNSGAADLALLNLGELELRQSLEPGGATGSASAGLNPTNLVAQALGHFESLLTVFPNSPLTGKALLDKGWCYWRADEFARSEEAFRQAVDRLPVSADQAVARFKLADTRFMLNDYASALANYQAVATEYGGIPEVKARLVELALYQTVRTALVTSNMPVANRSLRTLLEQYPDGFAGPHCLLLVGQELRRQKDPAGARRLFEEFEAQYPTNAMLPEVRLALARTFEEERNWNAAIEEYKTWTATFTNNRALPRAEFCRAWDYFMAGQETNALALFTDFTTRFRTNDLAPLAQWWIGDYYFRLGDNQKAELNYQLVRNSSGPSELTYEAQMMAGRAAMARLSPDAIRDYFLPLAHDTNCSAGLRAQAFFAAGDALMSRDSTNKPADFKDALTAFNSIFSLVSRTNTLMADAWGRIGECYLQLAAKDVSQYTAASNAFCQIFALTNASVTARSQAKFGLGKVAEGLAQNVSETNSSARETRDRLMRDALSDYLDIFGGSDLRPGELADPFWTQRAGREAGRLAEDLQQWESAIKIYESLKAGYPSLRPMLDIKLLHVYQRATQKED